MGLMGAAEYNLECLQLNYNTAVPGYEVFGVTGVSLVIILLKSSHGFHQSPTTWWNTIDEHLARIGFERLKWDACLHT